MIAIKPGAKITGLQPEILLALQIIYSVFRVYSVPVLTITEGTGAKHMEGSKHYKGLALDIRSKNIPEMTKTLIKHECNINLGESFDFFLEQAGEAGEHFHVELR